VAILLVALASALSPLHAGLRQLYRKIKGAPNEDIQGS